MSGHAVFTHKLEWTLNIVHWNVNWTDWFVWMSVVVMSGDHPCGVETRGTFSQIVEKTTPQKTKKMKSLRQSIIYTNIYFQAWNHKHIYRYKLLMHVSFWCLKLRIVKVRVLKYDILNYSEQL